MGKMVCPYDEQQCEYPRCLDPELENYYDERCNEVLKNQKEIGQKMDKEPVKRLDWMDLWDKLRNDLKTGNTTWGRNQILDLMDRLEREMIRKFERGE